MYEVVATKHDPYEGNDTFTRHLRDGDAVTFQGDILIRCRFGMNTDKLTPVPGSQFLVAHGESGNQHILQAVVPDEKVAWLREASQSINDMTEFAFGRFTPGQEMFFEVPDGGAKFRHEEHYHHTLHTPGVYSAIRQVEDDGIQRQNVWD